MIRNDAYDELVSESHWISVWRSAMTQKKKIVIVAVSSFIIATLIIGVFVFMIGLLVFFNVPVPKFLGFIFYFPEIILGIVDGRVADHIPDGLISSVCWGIVVSIITTMVIVRRRQRCVEKDEK